MKPNRAIVWATLAWLCAATSVVGQDKQAERKETDAEKKAAAAVGDYLASIKGTGAAITVKNEDSVRGILPEYAIVNARYRLYPVARAVPDGMRASNLFAVDKAGKLHHLKDAATLEKFFRTHAPAAKSEKDAKAVLAAWMVLTQEFHQDGMYKFEVQEKQFGVAQDVGLNARGRLIVMQGGNGDLVAELTFDKDGKLAKVAEQAKIRPGPRPICQATKLLDADPIVRRMAEQDLLIMGLASRDYLMEQRERAHPMLRRAIDGLWDQIQKNGW